MQSIGNQFIGKCEETYETLDNLVYNCEVSF